MHVREIRPTDVGKNTPIYAVWEITLRCDHACAHCGSRAATARPTELNLDELIETADALIRMGTREVTLIGGEAYLSPHVYPLVKHLADAGLLVSMQTGGRGLTPERCEKLVEAGMAAIGVSVDGPEEVHDILRAVKGSHAAALQAIDNALAVGLPVTTNMQVNRLTMHTLRQHYEMLDARRIRAWRCQLTVPMGRAADHPQWILQPFQILEVLDTMAELQHEAVRRNEERGLPAMHIMNVHPSNNLGYFGPHEELLRSRPGTRSSYWGGCPAGRYTIGIESDGVVKACPSLPTAPYVGGNVKDRSLEDIWNNTDELAFVRNRTTEELWGFCKTCYYADTCRAGCAWTAHCTLGKRGNNPFCYHRAATLKKQGRRERLEVAESAEGVPYDFGRMVIVEEDWR